MKKENIILIATIVAALTGLVSAFYSGAQYLSDRPELKIDIGYSWEKESGKEYYVACIHNYGKRDVSIADARVVYKNKKGKKIEEVTEESPIFFGPLHIEKHQAPIELRIPVDSDGHRLELKESGVLILESISGKNYRRRLGESFIQKVFLPLKQ